MNPVRIGVIAFSLCAALPAWARDIYVNPDALNDQASGLSADQPVKTIRQGIKIAQPGDTIYLNPPNARFSEVIEFLNRSGEPGKPIVLEGNGATLDGSDPLAIEDWTDQGNGLYRNDTLYVRRKFDPAIIARYFFLFDGKMQLMGRSSKGPTVPFKLPADLQTGEWTFIENEKAFYLRIDPNQSLADANIEHPIRPSGIMIYGGNCEHLVIRNVTATHFYNDGAGFHGRTRDILVENFKAIDNGDDGFSAHDDCAVTANGLYASGNSTGVCNTGKSDCTFDNMHLDGNVGYEFYVLQQSRNVVTNSYIASRAARPVTIGYGDKSEASHATFDNVLIDHRIRTTDSTLLRVYPSAKLEATRLTTLNLSWLIQGTVSLQHSLISGKTKPYVQTLPTASWTADGNQYDLKYIRIDKNSYAAEDFDAYKTELRQDKQSEWADVTRDSVLSPDSADLPGAKIAEIPAMRAMTQQATPEHQAEGP